MVELTKMLDKCYIIHGLRNYQFAEHSSYLSLGAFFSRSAEIASTQPISGTTLPGPITHLRTNSSRHVQPLYITR